MSRSIHDEAQELIALAGAEDLSADQQSWLRVHLEECGMCSEYAEAAGRTVRALRFQPLAADSALVQATQMRVRSRALEMREQKERIWLVCLCCVSVGLSAAITTPLSWRAFEWMGLWAGVSNWVWKAGFLFWWMAPALVVSALLLRHGTHLTDNVERQ